jgi:CxxC motif-containing protein (DUF1111 family)
MSAPARSRMRPVHWVVLALVLAPAWKAIEWARGTRPKAIDPRVAAAGEALFRHEWTPHDPLTKGDGLGPVFNARSCLECHNQGGAGGGGPIDKNVTVYGIAAGQDTRGIPPVGVVHQKAVKKDFQETLNQVDARLPASPSIPLETLLDRSRPAVPTGLVVTQRNTPALFGAGLLDAVSEDMLIKHQREHSTAARLVGLNSAKDGKIRGRIARLADGRIGRFGWKAEFSTLNDFVKAACANELGLSNPDRPQATPLGKQKYQQPGVDLTDEQCTMMADYILGLPKPVEVVPTRPEVRSRVKQGRATFEAIGCADCHSPDLGPASGIYSDLLLHDMGVELESSTGYYGSIIPPPVVSNTRFAQSEQPTAGEWRTAPLWGVADSAPYMHDGRAKTLDEAIRLHGGEASDVKARYQGLSLPEQEAVVTFLKTLRAPGAADLARAN